VTGFPFHPKSRAGFAIWRALSRVGLRRSRGLRFRGCRPLHGPAKRLIAAALAAVAALPVAGQATDPGARLRLPSLIQLQPSHQALLPSASWQVLSAAQIARYRSLWPEIGQDDLPPYPVQGFEELLGELRARGAEVGAREVLMLAVELDSAGAVVDVKPLRYSDDQLLKRAVWAIVDTKFRPAVCNGSACASTLPIIVKVPK
jgi:hypothetical protein